MKPLFALAVVSCMSGCANLIGLDNYHTGTEQDAGSDSNVCYVDSTPCRNEVSVKDSGADTFTGLVCSTYVLPCGVLGVACCDPTTSYCQVVDGGCDDAGVE
jgi:hypothetical protein